MNNQNQDFKNHTRTHPLYHFVFSLFTLGLFILAVFNIFDALKSGGGMLAAFLILVVSVMFIIVFLIIRAYPLKAQDRAIRAEENLRHFALTQKLLDPKLSVKQIVALRFASDSEFPSLCERAVKDQLSPIEIKKAIKNWKPDYNRI